MAVYTASSMYRNHNKIYKMIESIEVFLNYTSQQTAIQIHDAFMRNTWFGLRNGRRRVFFDIKNKTVYEIADKNKTGGAPPFKTVECGFDDEFMLLVKLTLLTCKTLMTDIELVTALTNFKLLLDATENTKDESKEKGAFGPPSNE